MKLYETITMENWLKGALIADGRQCLLGHIETPDQLDAVQAAVLVLFPERTRPGNIVWAFNDHADTTVEDVIRVCKLADV